MKKISKLFLIAAFLFSLIATFPGCVQNNPSPLTFEDGAAQPVFPFTEVSENYDNASSSIVRYCVWVETDNDMDKDGAKDLVKAFVQVPRSAYEGSYKAASIFEARPYIAGTQDLKVTDDAVETSSAAVDPQDWYYENPYLEGDRYYEDLSWYDYFLVRGFAVVSSAGPGTLGSDGYVSIGSPDETNAFASVIEWLHGDRIAYSDRSRSTQIKADWSNGNIGMTGKSYGGTTQYALAARGVLGLKTIVPVAGITRWYDYIQGQGVAIDASSSYLSYLSQYCCSTTFNADEFQKSKDGYLSFIKNMDSEEAALNGNYGEIWKERDYVDGLLKSDIPMLIVEGMNDDNVRTNQLIDIGFQLENQKSNCKMILHQGGHQVPANPTNHTEIMIGEQSYDEILNKWFSHYLYGVDNGIQDMSQNQYQSNIDGSWHTFESSNLEYNTIDFELENASVSSKTLPKNLDDWSNDVWYSQDNSAVKRYVLADVGNDGMEIFENMFLDLQLSADIIPENPEDLMVSAYLVDEYDDSFMAYIADDDSQVPTTVVNAASMEQVPESMSYDLVEYKQEECAYKIISMAWFDLCNPQTGNDPAAWIKPAEVIKQGETYSYTVVMNPVIYTVAPWHRLVLYVFPYDLGRINYGSEPEYITDAYYDHLNSEYSFTITEQSRLSICSR